ncbi:MAG: hypothetical protein JST55_15705 [Bacteroidetes bacterium]|nr:hypothetical protein [Bacteroidota bacterium]
MIIAVKCPSCYANLRIPDDVEFVNCEFCGTTIKVRDVIRIETDYDVPEWLKIADNAYKGENYEEAYEYYNMVLEKESFRCNAWIGKGLSAGRLSEESELRFDEMIQLVNYGLGITEEKNKEAERVAAKKEMLSILQDYFSRVRKDKFDDKSDFDDYAKDNSPFVKGCEKAYKDFFTNDMTFTKFYCEVLRNFLQKNYESDGESRTLIQLKEPQKTEYLNKLRTLENWLKMMDSTYISFDDSERKNKTVKLIVTGSALILIVLIAVFGFKYFQKISDENKAKVTEERTTSSNKLPAKDYEIISKSAKNKKIIYTILTETESLDNVKDYADAIIKKDESQALTITIYFLSNRAEASELGGKDIPLNKNQDQMPDSFSARVKFTKGKNKKELHYYSNSKLISETY